MNATVIRFLCFTLAWTVGMAAGLAADWPTYMHDPARSGVSSETLSLPLAELWVYAPPAESRLSERSGRAWPDPREGELPKLDFDNATHVALAGDMVFFGSSVDNGIHALDAATGTRRWTVFTDGPVRLAPTFVPTYRRLGTSNFAQIATSDKTAGNPTVADGRVYAGSDDGVVYCVEARDGRLVWSTRPLPGATRILGAGQMMSLWPIRTGVLVDGGVAYCGAGIFAERGKAIFALDAKSGKQIWKSAHIHNATHDSPQGYLVASAEQLYVFRGRAAALTYARADGTLRGSLSATGVQGKGLFGGGYGVLIDDLLYLGTQNLLFGFKPDGQYAGLVRATHRLVATSNRYYRLTGALAAQAYAYSGGESPEQVIAIDRAAYDADGRKEPIPKTMLSWRYQGSNLHSLIVAGPHVLVGGSNEVVALDAATGKAVWKGKVDGLANGLAVANGRLVVSTDKGRLHCFGKGLPARAPVKPATDPFPRDADTARITALAEAIARDARFERGYGLVLAMDHALGHADGLVNLASGAQSFNSTQGLRLAYELAKRTGLLIHIAVSDPATAAKARALLSAAGTYGTSALERDLAKGGKVVVDVAPPDGTNGLPYPSYFANLVVAKTGALGQGAATAREVLRMLKPCGGVLYAEGATPHTSWAKAGTVTVSSLTGLGIWTKLVRGRLPGARDWTHHLADAGNTGSSDDERVRGRPEVLWYGEPGPKQMHDRSSGSEAPLSFYGRMFVQGMREQTKTPLLLCFDAYNGVPYWERELPAGAERFGVQGDCGNLACSTQGLFLAVSNQCLRLDLLTGETRATYAVPAQTSVAAGKWAYVAVEGDTLAGSAYASNRFSNAVFAYDLRTGRLKWHYKGAVIRNSTLALQGGKVFFVESAAADGQAKAPDPLALAKAAQAARRGAVAAKVKVDGVGTNEPAPTASVPESFVRTVVALDLATGKQAWARDVDLAGCGDWMGNLCLIAKHDVVLLCGLYSAYGRPRDDVDQRRALALSAKDGATLWNRAIGNRVRPVVVGDWVIGRPSAFELRTGEPVLRDGRPWHTDAAGACGQMSASAGMLFLRSGASEMRDAETGNVLMNFSGMRPSCLINIIPAGGVIVQVEGSSGCACDYAMQATVAFVPPEAE